jgi:addiction module HigA family antidote
MSSSSTITEARRQPPRHAPVHPGEILQEEFLRPLGLTQYRLARDVSVPPRRINEIVHGTRAISADTALRLARFFGTTELFWLNLQAAYDLDLARDRLGPRLEREVVRHPTGRVRSRRTRGGAPRGS